MAFRNLLFKEIKSILPPFGIFIVVVVIMHLFVAYKSDVWNDEVMMVTSSLLPFMLLMAITLGISYYQLHTEWKTNSIYLLLSLPVRGWKLLTAKLVAVFSLFMVTFLSGLVSLAILFFSSFAEQFAENVEFTAHLPQIIKMAAHMFWMFCLAVIFLIVVVQFVYLCGQFVNKFKWLVVVSAFVVVAWLVFRISPFLSKLLLWTPDIFIDDVYLRSGPFIVFVGMIGGLIWLNGYIFEKEVEV